MSDHRIIFGDALDVLRGLDAESVDCCACSPPYWGLRDYGVEGQIGLEATPEEYVARLVEVFGEVRRVLKPGGTLWVNLGDSYARDALKGGSGPNGKHDYMPDYGNARHIISETRGSSDGLVGRADRAARRVGGDGLKPKDLCGIPWRVAFALQADGWWLRNDIIWAKPNPMPESVTDRFSSTYEHVFLLSRAARYWFDLDAVREEHRSTDRPPGNKSRVYFDRDPDHEHSEKRRQGQESSYNALGKNPGDVWRIATQPTPYAHFATWPEALVERMIRAGCPPKVCAACGTPWEHRVEKTGNTAGICGGEHRETRRDGGLGPGRPRDYEAEAQIGTGRDLGYHPACGCDADALPGTVLDPFLGSGTTTQVARKLGRRSIGIELNPAYEAVMRQRLGCPDGALFEDVRFE